jgi:hypothetical protein
MITNRATSLLHPKLNVGSGPRSRQPPTSADGPLPTHSGRWGRRNAGGKADIADEFLANTRFEVSAAAVQRQESVAYACFSEGFAQTLAWYLANEGWWRPVVERAQITR